MFSEIRKSFISLIAVINLEVESPPQARRRQVALTLLFSTFGACCNGLVCHVCYHSMQLPLTLARGSSVPKALILFASACEAN